MTIVYDEIASFSHLVGDLGLSELVLRDPPSASVEFTLNHSRGVVPSAALRVHFGGVAAHEFAHGGNATVIFDIAVARLESVVAAHPEWGVSARHHAWPVAVSPEETLIEAIRGRDLHAFELQSSCGLHGVILAESMCIEDLSGETAREAARWPPLDGVPPTLKG